MLAVELDSALDGVLPVELDGVELGILDTSERGVFCSLYHSLKDTFLLINIIP
jgi:hypothetical protein